MGTAAGKLSVIETSTPPPNLTYNVTCILVQLSCPNNAEMRAINPITTRNYDSELTTGDNINFTLRTTLKYQYDTRNTKEGSGNIRVTITAKLSQSGTKLTNPKITEAVVENLPAEYTGTNYISQQLQCRYTRCGYHLGKLTLTAEATYNYNGRELTMERTELETDKVTFV